MVSVFYIAAIIAVLASIKAISGKQSISALIYFVMSLLATSVVFFTMGAYFSAALVVIVSIGAVSILFLSVISVLNIKTDNVEQSKKGISPKIWLGPLILAFILFVTLIYSVASTDYSQLNVNPEGNINLTEMLLGSYILVVELAILLILGALVISYHFTHRIYLEGDKNKDPQDNKEVIK
ncbi:NADH-quinone oxidoreductase subunit J [Orbaceae bacterium ac157xtp]